MTTESHGTPSDELAWRCAGCGKPHPDRVTACDCVTAVLYDPGVTNAYTTKIKPPMDTFMAWVNQGPELAKAAGVYVGIKIYASEEQARQLGDIS